MSGWNIIGTFRMLDTILCHLHKHQGSVCLTVVAYLDLLYFSLCWVKRLNENKGRYD